MLRRMESPAGIHHDQLRPRKLRSDLRLAVYVSWQGADGELAEQEQQSVGDDDHQAGEEENAAEALEFGHRWP